MNKKQKTQFDPHNYVVILAGGGGTRLWPRSRQACPKQFLQIIGNQTMLQLTAERALLLAPWERIIIVTNKAHLATVQAQLPQAKTENIILEPEKKDTALAMLVGALFAHAKDPQAVVINSASDHYVQDLPEFTRVMNAAATLAQEKDALLTVGISPTRPETGFGYIRIGEEIGRIHKDLPVFKVENFTEKPNATTAAAFIATGKYFWNANMYVWSSQALIKAFKDHAPAIWRTAASLLETSLIKFNQVLPDIYTKNTGISIDYAISEKATNLLLLPGNFGWSDVGDWQVAYDLGNKDHNDNVLNENEKPQADFIAFDSRKNLVSCSKERLVALLGVDDLVIVDTDEILLVAKKERSQEVKKIVEELKSKKKSQYL